MLSASVVTQSADTAMEVLRNGSRHSSHPDLGHLILLVFEAVMEVVCVSLPGYIVARNGMFDANAQKFVAGLNMTLFTPCLIFSKLASQLTGDKLIDLIIIPFILAAQTGISWACAKIVTRLFKLNKLPQNNFVTAMAVFGNSNSLPLSLVISLSKTISGLHWDKIKGDNDDDVAARGILYLLVFSQLGQALRWSWGMNTLLKPLDQYTPAERGDIPIDEEESIPYQDDPNDDLRRKTLKAPSASDNSSDTQRPGDSDQPHPVVVEGGVDDLTADSTLPEFRPAESEHNENSGGSHLGDDLSPDGSLERPSSRMQAYKQRANEVVHTIDTRWERTKDFATRKINSFWNFVQSASASVFRSLPGPLKKVLSKLAHGIKVVLTNFWACLNAPLTAILFSVLVATIPPLQRFFFTPGTFVNNSVTRAVSQSGGVAVPLILVVLGANLARNTLPDEGKKTPEYKREERNILIAALLSRMLLPTIIMAPLLAITAKYVPVSILGDPIFIIVCFLLSGAPSALQLAQMCQVNGVFIGAASRLLLHSYVFWILPSTLILVVMALEVVEWAVI